MIERYQIHQPSLDQSEELFARLRDIAPEVFVAGAISLDRMVDGVRRKT